MNELHKSEDYVIIRKNPTSVVEKKIRDGLDKMEKIVSFPPHLKNT